MTCSCAEPLGTVNPALAPFWLTAEPAITPQIRSPSASASLNRFKITIPQPSPRTKPSAAESKVRHCPLRDSIPNSAINFVTAGESAACTPPAKAKSTSPRCRLATAWCTETNDDAHVMSSGTAGPMKPSTNAIRPTATLPVVPK